MKLIFYRKYIQNLTRIFGVANGEVLFSFHIELLTVKTKQIFSEVIKWFNNENATSLRYSEIEILFGRKFDDKNVDSYFVKKLNFILLYAKYYLYNQKVLCSEISMIDFMANLEQKYSLEGLSM